MKNINQEINIFKLIGLLLVVIIMGLTPLTKLNGYTIKEVYANSKDNIEIKDKANKLDKKIIYNGDIEDNFTGDKVIIALNQKETHKFKTYTSEDFPEIDCISVKDLTGNIVDYVKEEIGKKNDGLKSEKTKRVNVDSFRRILSLELGEKSKDNVIKAIKKLEKREEIIFAEPNYIATLCSTEPDDPFYDPIDPDYQWGLHQINAKDAWDITTGSNTITVGVMDTGIDGAHPDLINRISNLNIHRDFSNGTEVTVTTPTDGDGHGTNVAGIIGAEGNNGIGVSGVAWDIRLASLRVADDNRNIANINILLAILFAEDNNIPILNLSATTFPYSASVQLAIEGYDGLFVVAAGNDSEDNDVDDDYPSSYMSPNIISVGATHTTDNKSSGSNYGVRTVDIFAPGTLIRTTVPTAINSSGYGENNGTSFAAPFVTGVAALIMSIKPNMSVYDIKKCILYGADTLTSLRRYCLTSGRLNAFEALQLAQEDNDWWWQSDLTSNTNYNYGKTTASSNYPGREPYGAFDGWIGSVADGSPTYPAAQWTANATSGWLELKIDEFVKVSKIYFYNRVSSTNEYTKDAYFTGIDDVPLGTSFEGVAADCGVSVIEVSDVVTNIIKLNISSSHGTSYVGANEIRIVATPANWEQPVWTSNSNTDGTITASSYYGIREPYGAFDGAGSPAVQWTANSTTGWIELKLNYYIRVCKISFINRESSASEYTKDAFFTGTRGVALGEKFTAIASSGYISTIEVDNVVTNVIRLNILSSYGSAFIGAKSIYICNTCKCTRLGTASLDK